MDEEEAGGEDYWDDEEEISEGEVEEEPSESEVESERPTKKTKVRG